MTKTFFTRKNSESDSMCPCKRPAARWSTKRSHRAICQATCTKAVWVHRLPLYLLPYRSCPRRAVTVPQLSTQAAEHSRSRTTTEPT